MRLPGEKPFGIDLPANRAILAAAASQRLFTAALESHRTRQVVAVA